MKSCASFATAMLLLLPTASFAQSGVDGLLLPAPPAPTTVQQAAPAAVAPVAVPVGPSQAQRDQQFQQALEAAVPYSPEQIELYRRQMDAASQATVVPLNPGKPVSRSIRLNLTPGEATPVLRVEPGQVSTLTFSDITGKPWPVLSVVTGNPTAYVAQSAGEPGVSNIIVLSAVMAHIPSNLVVTLVDYPVPVTMSLAQGAAEVDFRVDVQLTARGPNAEMDMVGQSSLAPTDDSSMLAFLDGVPPSEARRMRTTSGDVEAWAYGDKVYVRTAGEVISPAYIGRAANVSGVNIFVIHEAPVVLLSRNGQMASVGIER